MPTHGCLVKHVWILDEHNLDAKVAENRPERALIECRVLHESTVNWVCVDEYGERHYPRKENVSESREEAKLLAFRMLTEKAKRLVEFAQEVLRCA